MLQPLTRSFCVCLTVITLSLVATAQSNLAAKANSFQPVGTGSSNDSDRARDGLVGPVRRVRTEVVKVSNASGKIVEDNKRLLLETAEYDLKGAKTQNQYFPVAGSTLTGRETYKYDDKGNISEMTLLNPDGSLLSKEAYKYEFDSIGNWVKMITSIAGVENQKIVFDPSEITYRTIFYYLDAAMAKMVQPSNAASVQLPPASTNNIRLNASQPPGANLSSSNSATQERVSLVNDGEAPAPRIIKPISGGVLNGKAINLPVPVYPQIAMRSRTAGKVEVEVTVDENGKVIQHRRFLVRVRCVMPLSTRPSAPVSRPPNYQDCRSRWSVSSVQLYSALTPLRVARRSCTEETIRHVPER